MLCKSITNPDHAADHYRKIQSHRLPVYDHRHLLIWAHPFCRHRWGRLEVSGVSLDRINSEIRSYVRESGLFVRYGEPATVQRFLSELQDEIAAALSRVQREIAEKEEKATALS